MSDTRLIEVAFPLKQTSIASVHEKNVRHGHISTLHIWPARRPLAACRAVLLATLLPDPGTDSARQALIKRIGGQVIEGSTTVVGEDGEEEVLKDDIKGGILKWKNENDADMDWFRAEIKQAYGGRAPKVLDPFAGGGAIPLEAMRLGCEATAMDINPVAWFILKCTLEYPQKLAGQKLPLPEFAVRDKGFMTDYLRSLGFEKNALQAQLAALNLGESKQQGFTTSAVSLEADLAWHVRAWGLWVLQAARRELARFYPTYAEFVPLKGVSGQQSAVSSQLVPLNEDGTLNMKALNGEFTEDYLKNSLNPRWVAKPTVAYLWARTVQCKRCRATIPLLKTRWLCKKAKKRVVLTMTLNEAKTGVLFGVVANPAKEETGAGTMSGSGSTCPGCGAIMTMKDLRLEAQAGNLGEVLTAVVVDNLDGKEYRLPTEHEIEMAGQAEAELERVYAEIPFGIPQEQTPGPSGPKKTGSSLTLYGLNQWRDIFTSRQLLALGTFVKQTRALNQESNLAGYSAEWQEAISVYLACAVDKLADRSSTQCIWISTNAEKAAGSFGRFALQITWDFAEIMPWSEWAGGFPGSLNHIVEFLDHAISASNAPTKVFKQSAMKIDSGEVDVILTDPPYYDAIPYSDLMDFFYVWLRRTLYGLSSEMDKVFADSLAPKWSHEQNDGELIDDPMRFEGNKEKSKQNYEDGMFRAFQACYQALQPAGRLVVVFANKQPEAWETLVSAVVRAGFVVTGSWPIQTEREGRMRAQSSAALASSIWLVCKKRDKRARPGWDNQVLAEMQGNITKWLHRFWDAGIRGPDFVWAATGPAMEAFSKYPVVLKATQSGEKLSIAEFLRQVRRMVVNFVVGRVLHTAEGSETTQLDDLTTYYLLHRNDFGLEEAPSGACILYALTCNLSDRELGDKYGLVEHKGSTLKLVAWDKRKSKEEAKRLKGVKAQTQMDLVAPAVSPSVALIDQIHVLMNLWKAGEVAPIDRYLQQYGLLRLPLFQQVLQAIIELAVAGSEERSIAESLSNHVKRSGGAVQMSLANTL